MPFLSANPMWEAFGTRAMLLTAAEGDPSAAGADALAAAIGPRATVVRFTAAEGAGGHCEGTARSLFEQRAFDWLDETLAR